MFLRLTEPVAVSPDLLLGRLVADPLDPLRELAPPVDVIIDARILTLNDTVPTPSTPSSPSASSPPLSPSLKRTHRHVEPWSTWDALNTHPRAKGALSIFLELHPRASYFVVGVRTRRRRDGEQPVTVGGWVDGHQEAGGFDNVERLEGTPQNSVDVISEVEYIKVTVDRKGQLVFEPYGTLLAAKISHARKWSHDHPQASRALKAGAIGLGVAAAVPLAVGATLGAIGFGAGGIAAGSIAAAIQASLGAAGAGSLIAACEAIGVAGLATGTVLGIGAATASVAIDTAREQTKNRAREQGADDEQDAHVVYVPEPSLPGRSAEHQIFRSSASDAGISDEEASGNDEKAKDGERNAQPDAPRG
ncbi:hypothetical protein BKA62DRAFT_432157 [Auriculariales sp. MPI-PUGE-AT-0066]|nr:hypothetical protein BKA62DRAFT_432157 [Auriculariales sp. MPI-PUGE-AT-0066]